MSKTPYSLTDTAIKHTLRDAKGALKAQKLVDEKGLFLLVKPTGAALWRFRYVLRGKENSVSLGSYPDTSLKRAREKRDTERRLI
ncbi:MAG TPA: Arm DNA-binding domain-containing protein, partial [Steroidobacteraceae bacterium]